MNPRLKSGGLDETGLWVAAALAVLGAAVAVLVPAGGPNRIAGVAIPFAIAAAALASNALVPRRISWLTLLLYVAAWLALVYGIILALSIPLRLTVEGVCQPQPAPCPLGFDRPLSSAEDFSLYAVVILAALSLTFSFIAAELRYRRGHRLPPPSAALATPPAPAGQDGPPETGP